MTFSSFPIHRFRAASPFFGIRSDDDVFILNRLDSHQSGEDWMAVKNYAVALPRVDTLPA